MAKLTLSIDDGVFLRAKRYAKRQGLSISEMVEAYLDLVTRDAPILGSLRGSLKMSDVEAYKRRLAAKYR